MEESEKEKDVDAIVLPRQYGGFRKDVIKVDWNPSELEYPDINKMIGLVRSFCTGKEKDVHQVIEFFIPFAHLYAESISADVLSRSGEYKRFALRRSYLENTWEDFSFALIAHPFLSALKESGLIAEQIPAEVLCYPMFAKRRICDILRVEHPQLLLELLTIHPLDGFTCKQLWHPNEENTASVRQYYRSLSQCFLTIASDSSVLVEDFLQFCSLVKSPYRSMFEKYDSNEIQNDDSGVSAHSIQKLSLTRTGILHRIREDQLVGTFFGDILAPAAIQPKAIQEMSVVWLADESEVFFSNLPSRLLAYISEMDIRVFQKLARQFGVEIGRFFNQRDEEGNQDISQWLAPIEFPHIQKEAFVYRQFSRMPEIESPEELSKDLTTIGLLVGVRENNKKKLDGFARDRARLRGGFRSINQRKEERPWDARDLFSELRLVEQRFHRLELAKKAIDLKQEWVEQRLNAVNQEVTAECLAKHNADSLGVREHYAQVVDSVLKLVDPILGDLDPNEVISFNSVGILDPLFCASVFSFTQSTEILEQIKEALQSKNLDEIREEFSECSEAVEHAAVFHALKIGKSVESLKKHFEVRVIERCFVEISTETFEELRSMYPKLSNMIHKVEERKRFEKFLAITAKYLTELSKRLTAQIVKNQQYKELTPMEQRLIRATIVEVVWEWFFKSFNNPYGEVAGEYDFDDIHSRRLMFVPWFEQELAAECKRSYPQFYLKLALRVPAACIGFEAACDFNWRKTPAAANYVTALVSYFLENCRMPTGEGLFKNYCMLLSYLMCPFLAVRDEGKYDIELVANYVLQLDISQQHLYTTEERRILIKHWANFHQLVFAGIEDVTGLISILFLKELRLQDEQTFRSLLAALNNNDQTELFQVRSHLFALRDRFGEDLEEMFGSELDSVDARLMIGDLMREALIALEAKDERVPD